MSINPNPSRRRRLTYDQARAADLARRKMARRGHTATIGHAVAQAVAANA